MVIDFTAEEARRHVEQFVDLVRQNEHVVADDFLRVTVLPAIRLKSTIGSTELKAFCKIPITAFLIAKKELEEAGYVVTFDPVDRIYTVSWEEVEPLPTPDPCPEPEDKDEIL